MNAETIQLIKYKEKSILSWNELPRELMQLFTKYCDSATMSLPSSSTAVAPMRVDTVATALASKEGSANYAQLVSMGFHPDKVQQAISAANGDITEAVAILVSEQAAGSRQGGKKTRRRRSYKRKTKKKKHKVKKNLPKKERKTRGSKVKTQSTKKKN